MVKVLVKTWRWSCIDNGGKTQKNKKLPDWISVWVMGKVVVVVGEKKGV